MNVYQYPYRERSPPVVFLMSITNQKIARFCRTGEDIDLERHRNSLQPLLRLLKLPPQWYTLSDPGFGPHISKMEFFFSVTLINFNRSYPTKSWK